MVTTMEHEKYDKDMKPIETIYKGYKFRSRLEARWAKFFDCCDIKYEYEPEGFEIIDNNGVKHKYLPDFYLPDATLRHKDKGVYIEIKHSNYPHDELFKLLFHFKKPLIIFFGNPWDSISKGYECWSGVPTYWNWVDGHSDIPYDNNMVLRLCSTCGDVNIDYNNHNNRYCKPECNQSNYYSSENINDDEKIKDAKLSAQQERFDYTNSKSP